MTVLLNLSAETELRLREKAARNGQSLESYLEQLAENDTGGRRPEASPRGPGLSPAEFDRLLEDLAEGLPGLPTLPADFARADLYADHA
jgi:hypothetical protein